jgi:hypothetical protein
MLFSTGLSDRDEGHDDIRGKHSAEQPKSYMKGHPSSPFVKPLAGLYLQFRRGLLGSAGAGTSVVQCHQGCRLQGDAVSQ